MKLNEILFLKISIDFLKDIFIIINHNSFVSFKGKILSFFFLAKKNIFFKF